MLAPDGMLLQYYFSMPFGYTSMKIKCKSNFNIFGRQMLLTEDANETFYKWNKSKKNLDKLVARIVETH